MLPLPFEGRVREHHILGPGIPAVGVHRVMFFMNKGKLTTRRKKKKKETPAVRDSPCPPTIYADLRGQIYRARLVQGRWSL